MYGPYQQPPKKSRTGLIVGLAVGAAVLLAGGAVTVVALTGSSEHTTARNNGLFTPAASPTTPAPSTSPPKARTRPARSVTLRPPSSAAGYKQMKGSIVKRSLDAMRAQMGKLSDNAKIAIYSKGASRLVYIGISGADDRQIASELSRSPSSEVDAVFMGSGITNPKDYPTGSIGGVLRCGKTRQQASAVTICAWADSSAVITLEAGAITPQKLSSILLTFHNASIRTAVPGA
jgi:hypothetical protein